MGNNDNKPKVVIKDGNAFAIMGQVSKALKRAGRGDEVEEYLKNAKSGDYDNLLRVTLGYVEILLEEEDEEEDEDESEYDGEEEL